YLSFFFLQAEDGIRDLTVTGVQTCALPIYRGSRVGAVAFAAERPTGDAAPADESPERAEGRRARDLQGEDAGRTGRRPAQLPKEIGRASCRERVSIWVGEGIL